MTNPEIDFANLCDERDRNLAKMLIEESSSETPDFWMDSMAVFSLFELQKKIISIENYLLTNQPNHVSNQQRVDTYKEEHQSLYDNLVAKFGNRFNELYDEITQEEVDFPKFNPDGSHD